MKCKVTSKELRANYGPNIVRIGYCDAQHLLRGVKPFGYNAGTYGWNYDAYDMGGLCLVTGYRSMPGRSVPNGLVSKYDQKAEALLVKEWRADTSGILAEFLEALREELNK